MTEVYNDLAHSIKLAMQDVCEEAAIAIDQKLEIMERGITVNIEGRHAESVRFLHQKDKDVRDLKKSIDQDRSDMENMGSCIEARLEKSQKVILSAIYDTMADISEITKSETERREMQRVKNFDKDSAEWKQHLRTDLSNYDRVGTKPPQKG